MSSDLGREDIIRRDILAIYNKREEDFATTEEWYNYEEEREAIIENLIDGKDIPETQAKIAKYQADNRAERLQKSIANLNDRQGTELKGELAPELEAVAPSGHGTSVEGQDWDLDAIRRIVENTPPADRERLERISGGWNEEAAKKRVETEFLCSLAF